MHNNRTNNVVFLSFIFFNFLPLLDSKNEGGVNGWTKAKITPCRRLCLNMSNITQKR